MEFLPIAKIVGYSAVAVVVIAWLVVSFAGAESLRDRAARVGAVGLYLALCALFANLTLRAWEGGGWLALFAFGFLLAVFSGGFAISLFKALAAFRRSKGQRSHVAH